MKKVWMHKTDSFQKAEKFEEGYYLSLSPKERLGEVQFLREEYFKLKPFKESKGSHGIGRNSSESRKRLRRVLKVIKQT
ncbi:hypothetical protein ES703_18348 [subsurface metagenome]